jgi:predicted nucleic acid-binding protein
MLVVDTDVVVGHLTNDDRVQAERARRLIEQHDVYLPLTVLLESEWVLRSVYGFPPGEIVGALRRFSGLPRVTVESADAVATALDWAERGLDLADALHRAAARGHEGVASFDRTLARMARRVGAPMVKEP